MYEYSKLTIKYLFLLHVFYKIVKHTKSVRSFINITLIPILFVEVSILSEHSVQSEHYMQGLNDILVGVGVMYRDIQNIEGNLTVILQSNIEVLTGQLYLTEHLLNFGWPGCHQTIDIWHSLRVADTRRLLTLVDVCYGVYPCDDLLGVFLCVWNRVHFCVFVPGVDLAVESELLL